MKESEKMSPMDRMLRRFLVLVGGLGIVAGLQASAEVRKEASVHDQSGFIQALDCLLNRDNDWFAPTFATQKVLRLKYVKWAPDPDFRRQDSLFIAAYKKNHLNGEVIHVVIYRNDGKVLYIVNNTPFRKIKGGYDLYSALGGLWTQGRMTLALEQMEKLTDIEISRDLVKQTETVCHWYGENLDENGTWKTNNHGRSSARVDRPKGPTAPAAQK